MGLTGGRTTQEAAATALHARPFPVSGLVGRAVARAPIYYGWVIVAVGAVAGAATMGVVQAFSVFLPSLQEDLGAGRAALALAFSLHMVVYGTASPVSGALADRLGIRRLVAGGGVLFGLGLLLAARSGSALQLTLAFGGVAALGMGALNGPLQYLTARWFDRRKGLALGVLLAGGGLGTMLASPLAAVLIREQGWRTTFVVLGVGAAAIIAGTCWLLVDSPAACGLRPDGLAPAGPEDGKPHLISPWTSAAAMRTPAFWILQGTFFGCCASHSGPLVHAAAHAVDVGVGQGWAAGMLSTFGACAFVGRICLGVVADRVGGRPTLIGALAVQTALVATLGGLSGPWGLMGFAALFGLAYGGVFAQYPVILREYFGATRVGAAYGTTVFLGTLGMAFGPFLAGLIHDVTGTYRVPFWVNGALGGAATLLALGLAPPAAPGVSAPGAASGEQEAREESAMVRGR